MAKKIDSKVVFITTSPRTPAKMIPEIDLLNQNFKGALWNRTTQVSFMDSLKEADFFHGDGANDPSFSARDRINRAPKALGFVKLTPTISLTKAGERLISSKRTEEIFLRQLLKFQLPSPYHTPSEKAADFWVKPYLEFFRLIRTLGTLSFDEFQIFGLQLVNYNDFELIVTKIKQFRLERLKSQQSYKEFRANYLIKELREIHSEEIIQGNTKTRETTGKSLDKFLATKASNMRDYADACFRYLRSTGLVNVSHQLKSISIEGSKIKDVDYFLDTIDRDPCFTQDEDKYVEYLGDDAAPALLTDDKELLINKISAEFPSISTTENTPVEILKEMLFDSIEERKEKILISEVADIKSYKLYDDIQSTFEQIKSNKLYDAPLILEWNTWRAMTMLDGGNINANLKFDDFGKPMSTAGGNMADIVCDYGDFGVCVEVTLSSGQRQYEMEGEPVARHLAKYKKQSNKPAYCLFVAPKINEACIAHFFTLHKLNISYYGGTSIIVPIEMDLFRKMLEDSYSASYQPQPKHLQLFFERANKLAGECDNEVSWYNQISEMALNWLS